MGDAEGCGLVVCVEAATVTHSQAGGGASGPVLPPVFLAWPLGFAVAGVSRQDPSAIGGSAEPFAYAHAHSTTWCQTPLPGRRLGVQKQSGS